jgi:hypothetical protein
MIDTTQFLRGIPRDLFRVAQHEHYKALRARTEERLRKLKDTGELVERKPS